ncbi:hypothetical protein JAAARDRAFT_58896 [Jaapia argillacea MUCL 33604]|uniref:Uncharacterized protein n=1 Tax=Jaapia argillacea MUCL 33604 TaxID=933084 RepID=A0A067PPB8_9AGAM|nr:hypothetical protein JAAARDRAFT_58896 [Jaapia argillacea MUCL 33604]
MAAVLAPLARFIHEPAMHRIYTTIRITRFTRIMRLDSALTRNKTLAARVQTLIIDIGGDFETAKYKRKHLDAIFAAVSPTLQGLHILRLVDREFSYPWRLLNLHSLQLNGIPPMRYRYRPKLSPDFSHVISELNSELWSFPAKMYPSLTHLATSMFIVGRGNWERAHSHCLRLFLDQKGRSLRFLVVVLVKGTEQIAIPEIREYLPSSVELVPLLLPPGYLYEDPSFCRRDSYNIREKLLLAHLNGSLWDVERCTTDVVFKGLQKHNYSIPSQDVEYDSEPEDYDF